MIKNLIINSLKIQTNSIVYTTQTFRSILFIFCPFFFLSFFLFSKIYRSANKECAMTRIELLFENQKC